VGGGVSESTKGAPQPSCGDSVERVCERAKSSRSKSTSRSGSSQEQGSKDQQPETGAGAGNALQVLQLAQLIWVFPPFFYSLLSPFPADGWALRPAISPI